MRKLLIALCIALALCLGTGCLAEGASGSAWKLDYYVDEFRLPTDEPYVTNAEPITGIFSNSATTDSELAVSILVDENGLAIVLNEYGSSRVKNSFSKLRIYSVTMLDDAREKTSMRGMMLAGDDRILFEAATRQTILDALSTNSSVSFYIEEENNPSTNYLFTVSDTSGFADAMAALNEMLYDGDYQNAVELYNSGDYMAAIEIFARLGDYKDSAEWLLKSQEMKYGEAEAFEEAGELWKAAIAFNELSDYRDSKARSFALWDQVTGRNKAVAAGAFHTVCLKSNGTVLAAGDNWAGQCDVSGWSDIVAISAGSYHTVGLRSNGTVVAASNDPYNMRFCNVSDWSNIVAVAAGTACTLGLKSDGTVVMAGWSDGGEGDVSSWTDIIAIAAVGGPNGSRSLGLKSDGTVVVAGSNNNGECDVSGWSDIVAVAAGARHTVGLKSDGTVIATGSDAEGQCDVSGWSDIVAIAAGDSHTVGLKSDGTVVATGSNEEGQCGVSSWTDIVAISAGGAHTVGQRSDGTVVAVGYNDDGRCDVSSWTDIRMPYGVEAHPVTVPSTTPSPAPTATPVTYPTLQRGDKGDSVQALQERLIELGYLSGSADGDFGGKSEAAVKEFQQANGLEVTGVADDATQQALFSDGAVGK